MSKKLLPDILKGDERVTALAELIGKSRQETQELLPSLFIYDLSTLSESELEDLAWQFDVSRTAWELAQDRSQKEELVKNAVILKMKLGTPWAIRKVLEILKVSGTVKEWFEYGGDPYRFKVEVSSPSRQITPELRNKLIQLINEYKNERSRLDEILLSYLATSTIPFAIGQLAETESFAKCQTELEWLASGSIPFAISAVAETEAVAVMEA